MTENPSILHYMEDFVLAGVGGAGRALAFGGKSRGAHNIIFYIDLGEAQSLENLNQFKPEKGAFFANATPLETSLLHLQQSQSQLPSFDFAISTKKSPSVIIGTWYCPSVFIRENARLREQMRRSILYKMTLEQQWEEIYTWKLKHGQF
ncbi:uncharacterized protein [Euphorbia lathyris]|uniref:uncharacterized protein n=1 Tax=Euphorbia lathyris TaxID=212925 RepID=UPI003313AC6B